MKAFRSLVLWWPIWALLVALTVGCIWAYQRPISYSVDVGSPSDQAFVRNFHTRLSEGTETYRWSDVYGYVSLPGLGGSRPFTVSVMLDPARTADVTLIVNGAPLFTETLRSGWQALALRLDVTHPYALDSRDTVLEIRAPDYRTEDAPGEAKGVKVSSVSIQQDGSGGFISTPVLRLALLLGSVLLVYLFVGLALAGFATIQRARVWGLAAALALAAGILGWMVVSRIDLTEASSHLFFTALTMLGLLVVVERIATMVDSGATPLTKRLLALCMAVGFGLRYGGMALPQSVIIDMPWHMKWLETLLTGNWQALYFPSPDGLSSVPREWGLNVLIPKSPIFYFAVAPFSVLPFELETLAKWLICLIDSTLVVAVYWFSKRACGSWRAGLWASALYALMPLAFRAFAYGILPTIFAQWLATGFLVALLASADKGWSVLRWIGLILLLMLALLAFPTVALFLTLITLALWLVWWLASPKAQRPVLGARYLRIPVLVVVAWALSLVAYYGIYAEPVIASVQALLAHRPGGGSTVRWPGGFPELLSWTASYVVTVLPVIIGVLGLALLFAGWSSNWERRKAVLLLAVWVAIAPLFLVVNLRVDMIGKHLFFVMVPLAVLGGVALWRLSMRRRASLVLASLVLATVGWQGLIFWIDRLVRASS